LELEIVGHEQSPCLICQPWSSFLKHPVLKDATPMNTFKTRFLQYDTYRVLAGRLVSTIEALKGNEGNIAQQPAPARTCKPKKPMSGLVLDRARHKRKVTNIGD
jgi:hypothetical protein